MAILIHLYTRRIPFLVIEPTKTEYRSLKRLKGHPDEDVRGLARELRVFPAANELIPLYRHNLLDRPEGISVNERIGDVMHVFDGALPLGGSLPAILAEALELCFEEAVKRGRPPLLADLAAAAVRILAGRGYGAEVFGNLQRRNSIPDQHADAAKHRPRLPKLSQRAYC
ncbi:MAG: hypothetical protein KAY37_11630 [Phycisphaerae bacterium]|nr:hypothetical protein [Phycisphaerae bacterium]